MYKQSEPFTCGPSAYMIAFSTFKNKQKELKYHEMGRIKPSRIFLGVSFLEMNSHLSLYIQEVNKLADGVVRLTFNKNIPEFEREIKTYYSHLMHKHKHRIHKISYNPFQGHNGKIRPLIELLDKSLVEKKKILLLVHSSHWMEKGNVHWVVVRKRLASKDIIYVVDDPLTAKRFEMTLHDLYSQFSKVLNQGFHLQMVTN